MNEIAILVVGNGVMGRGIARLFDQAGFDTCILSRRMPAGDTPIPVLDRWPQRSPQLIVESVIEDLAAKQAVYREAELRYGGAAVIASNTSGLPLEKLAATLAHKERFLGMHFFMPADVFPMIEVVRTAATADEAFELAQRAVRLAGRTPVVLDRPVIGYVINRLQHAILHEAYHMVGEGITSADVIDAVARDLLGPRMCVSGLLQQKDIGGLGIHANAQRSIVPALAHTGVPEAALQERVERGDTGLDAGRGFYDWSGRQPQHVRDMHRQRLVELLAFLRDGLGPAPQDISPVGPC